MAIKGNRLGREYISLAASSASVEEQAKSALKDGKFPDGTTPISVEKTDLESASEISVC